MSSTPKPPYFAVIFTSVRTAQDPTGYEVAAQRMVELAERQPGFLGVDSVRGAGGLGITVSYWQTEESIRRWRDEVEHRLAQQQGRAKWYSRFSLRVCRVERAWDFAAGP